MILNRKCETYIYIYTLTIYINDNIGRESFVDYKTNHDFGTTDGSFNRIRVAGSALADPRRVYLTETRIYI